MTHDERDTRVGVYEFRSHLAVGRGATAVFCHGTCVLLCEHNACSDAFVYALAGTHEAVDRRGVNEPFIHGREAGHRS